jgi:hypothetical protein
MECGLYARDNSVREEMGSSKKSHHSGRNKDITWYMDVEKNPKVWSLRPRYFGEGKAGGEILKKKSV